jgi:carbon-monoxide dehydrogenase medium subunit
MVKHEVVMAGSLEEALRALQAPGAMALAGATDVIPAMRRREISPRWLVNLKAIPELSGIRRARGCIRIGAVTKVAELLEHPLILEEAPVLAEVAAGFGSPLVRNLATVGGNLCNAAPSADLALPLLALGARVDVYDRGGRRELELCELFRGVNKTVLGRTGILVAVVVPRMPARTGAAFEKLGVRRAMDLSVVGAAAALTLGRDGRRCRRARIALGAVAPIPMLAKRAQARLEGEVITAALIKQAAAEAAGEARPISDLRASGAYRRDMVRALTARVLARALRRARREER